MLTQVIDDCELKGYQSDLRCAQMLMRCRVEQCYGLRRLAQELNQKGTDSELAKQLLEESELDWFVLAEDYFNRKYRRQYNPDDRKSKERCLRSMSARGFSVDEIFHAIDQL